MANDPANTQAQPGDDAVELEYTGQQTGVRTFIGRMTGTRYRFGSDDAHKKRRVDKRDVGGLMELGLFKTASDSSSSSDTSGQTQDTTYKPGEAPTTAVTTPAAQAAAAQPAMTPEQAAVAKAQAEAQAASGSTGTPNA